MHRTGTSGSAAAGEPELTRKRGRGGFQREDAAPSSRLPFSLTRLNVPAIKSAQTAVYFASFCEAGTPFGVTSSEGKLRLGTRYSLPRVLWRATSDYKDFPYPACFICHLFPIWTL